MKIAAAEGRRHEVKTTAAIVPHASTPGINSKTRKRVIQHTVILYRRCRASQFVLSVHGFAQNQKRR